MLGEKRQNIVRDRLCVLFESEVPAIDEVNLSVRRITLERLSSCGKEDGMFFAQTASTGVLALGHGA
jgi:hypothetical protein